MFFRRFGYLVKFIDKILGIDKLERQATQNFEMLTGSFKSFSSFNGDAYSSDIYRSAVDSIAKHIGKLSGRHVYDGMKEDKYSRINRILQYRPNPYMSGYDFLYKVATHYYLYNNAFIYVQKDDKGNLTGLYPLSATSVEYVTDSTGEMYIKFLFDSGKIVHLNMNEVATLRRHFNSNDLLGDDNNAIMPALNLAHTQNEGMDVAIKNSAQIRGIVKYNQALSPSKLKEAKEEFMNNYLTMANNGGVIPIDATTDYTPLNPSETHVESNQVQAVKEKIYDYLGINGDIVSGNYNEDQWQSFFESVIEPFAIQISLELTEKIFTEREKSFSNRIVYESSRLQYASTKSKATVIKELLPLGVLTTNQALDLLNLPRVEDGDERIQSLNYIDKSIAKTYQMEGVATDEGN